MYCTVAKHLTRRKSIFEAWFSRMKTHIRGAWLIFTNTSGKKRSASEFLVCVVVSLSLFVLSGTKHVYRADSSITVTDKV
jgi:hypothetical protein